MQTPLRHWVPGRPTLQYTSRAEDADALGAYGAATTRDRQEREAADGEHQVRSSHDEEVGVPVAEASAGLRSVALGCRSAFQVSEQLSGAAENDHAKPLSACLHPERRRLATQLHLRGAAPQDDFPAVSSFARLAHDVRQPVVP
jgi:hypothetical protein